MMFDSKLSELGVPGKVWITIRAEDIESNRAVLAAFEELSRLECKNDHTIALRKLLEYYEADAKTEMLWNALGALVQRVEALEQFNAKKEAPTASGFF